MKNKPATADFFHDDLPRRQQLVTPAWLCGLMGSGQTVASPYGRWCLFEAGFEEHGPFLRGHIPGANYLDTNRLEHGPLWNKVRDAELLQLLLDIGVRHDTTVILYGRNMTAAARVAHLMLYAGVRDVRLLDGGLAAWSRAGYAIAPGPSPGHAAVADFGAAFPLHPRYLAHTQEVKDLQPDATLASIRTWDEFTGRTSGYDYIEAKGEIPGAVWGRAGEAGDMNSMSAFQNPDGTMKPAEEILGFWREAGIRADRHTVFYCGTGWRASLAFFYAWLMGWDNISVYDGGWLEWSSDARNPRAVMVPSPSAADTRPRGDNTL